MHELEASAPTPPDREKDPPPAAPEREPDHDPSPEPWSDPGTPARKVNLPPDAPSPGVHVPMPDAPLVS